MPGPVATRGPGQRVASLKLVLAVTGAITGLVGVNFDTQC